jgi:hypothetical protein
VTVTKTSCNNADAIIKLKDNKGNSNSSLIAFAGFDYGMVNILGDTTWYATRSFSFFIGTKRSVTFVAKDPCDNVHSYVWKVPEKTKPSVTGVGISNTTCTQFTATVNGEQNLTNPVYTLFDNANTEQASNNTGVFENLSYGDYCIQVRDACYDTTIVKCFTAAQPTPSVSNAVTVSNETCATFTATITGQMALNNSQYCLFDINNVLLSCNSTGVFNDVPYGSYCIRITDDCSGAVLDRCFTATKPTPSLTTISKTGQNCTSFDVKANGNDLINPEFCLYDSLGNVVTCNSTGVFTGIGNGSYCIRAISCGDTTAPLCFSGIAPKPAVDADVKASSRTCSTFTASITGQVNLTTPQYCLYDSTSVLIRCNTTGIFDTLPYGRYCIKITDGCYDTTIVRCFTRRKLVSEVDAVMQQLNTTCSTFTANVVGQKNLFNPQYCIYDAANNQVECNTTGIFNNLPYGTYCVVLTDGCTGDTLRICQTFTYKYSITLATSRPCTIGSANVDVSFENGNSPFAISIYDPADTLVYSGSATSTTRIVLPGLAADGVYTVIGMDACGQKDTATIIPEASIVTKRITATGKCPSATWLNGSGDLHIDAISNLGSVTPKLIKKDGATFSKTHSSNSGTEYVFSDIEPASYIVEYNIQNCSITLYDTFALEPYTYPTQGRSVVYQCDNGNISLNAEVAGGVGPYKYQIIGSEPEVPSVTSAEQASPTFNINTGTTYSLIRLRTVDACGNATLNDVSVLPLQNISITADSTCLFSDITLAVDTIEEATYSWYKKRDESDSVFLGNDKTYSIPFMQQQNIGTYICKVELHNSCLTRLASFELTGDCGNTTLAAPVKLTGRAEASGNALSWHAAARQDVVYFEIERQANNNSSFKAIGRVRATGSGTARYRFTDTDLRPGAVSFRVKVVLQDGSFDYSNSIRLQRDVQQTRVYPNPVHTWAAIQINGTATSNYRIELLNMAGQVVYRKELLNITSMQFQYERPKNLQRGMYLLKILNRTNGTVSHYKLFFD